MAKNTKLAEELLEKISGGTVEESAELAATLLVTGNGLFMKVNPGRNDLVDIEAIQEFMAKKGYKFIPGFGDQPNTFIGPDGLPYGNDYIVYMLRENKL